MSSSGYTSQETVGSELPRRDSKESPLPSSRTSQDTLFNAASRRARKEKKKPPRPKPLPIKKTKISEQIAGIFADELAGGAQYVNPSDVLDKFVAPSRLIMTEHSLSTSTKVDFDKDKITVKHTHKQKSTYTAIGAMKAKYKTSGSIFSLDDLMAINSVEGLLERFGKVSHMGILDKSYSFFITQARDAALYFKVHDKVAVVGGDPLCELEKVDSILAEFEAYRKRFGWSVAFLGSTIEFVEYARSKNWITMQFGVERVLNPITNPVLLEQGAGKRTLSNSKSLLKKNVSLGIYVPKHGSKPQLQEQLVSIYTAWCAERNDTRNVQAYITVLDPFAIPELMIYIYTRDESGAPNGFAALRKIVDGYHLDPCIALPGAPRGISELLVLSAMSLLQTVNIAYLSLGFEPSTELGDITGIPKAAQAFFDKFRPDDEQRKDLYLVIPTKGLPGLKHMKALMHTANIDISKLMFEDIKRSLFRDKSEKDPMEKKPREDSRKSSSEDFTSNEDESRPSSDDGEKANSNR